MLRYVLDVLDSFMMSFSKRSASEGHVLKLRRGVTASFASKHNFYSTKHISPHLELSNAASIVF